MNWINILHFYQPITVTDEIINEVVKSSYKSWVDFLLKYKNVKVTMNFTGCLSERLFNSGYQKLLNDFSKIAARGQIEFLETAAFHPILPLLPEKEIVKQININHQINKLRFGKVYNPQGFFLPEMAYSEKVGRIIKKMGYKYIILDEIALTLKHFNTKTLKHSVKVYYGTNKKYVANSQLSSNIKYKLKNGLFVIFRNRKISQTFVPETIINLFVAPSFSSEYKDIITASDGELYGHRYWNWWPIYTEILKHKNTENTKTQKTQKHRKHKNIEATEHGDNLLIKTLTCSEYLGSLKQTKTIKPIASSWESTSSELKRGVPYALWNNPKNKIHKLLWQLSNFALKLNWDNQKDTNHFASRLHLEKGLSSCTFWWASNKDFKLFSPRAWDPQMVEKGAQELLASVRSLNNINPQTKLKAEKLFSQIRGLVWKRHWKKNE